MKRLANKLDPTRPIVAAMDNNRGRGMTAVIDIQGFNYRDPQMADFHGKFPAKPIVGTESGSTVATRGIYENDKAKGYVSAYDVNFPYWASTAETWWRIHAEHPYISGKQMLNSRRETTGEVAAIVLRPDRARIAADGADVSMVRVEVVDSQGRLVPTADHEIVFAVSGGRLLGVGNGDPSSHESDRGPTRRAFNGLCMAIVQSSGKPGDLKVEASAQGLTGASVTVVTV